MRITSAELLSAQWVMPRLLTWFNAQSAQDRTIPINQMYLIKVTLLNTADGTPVFVVGTDPSAANPATSEREYLGDVTYLWTGLTGSAVTAVEADFFELSKTIQPYVTVIPYTLTIHEGDALPFMIVLNEHMLPA